MIEIREAAGFRLERPLDYGTPEQNEAARRIVEDVRREGDAAVLRYAERFDGVSAGRLAGRLKVEEAELEAAYERVDAAFLEALRQAAANIRDFHERQKRQSWIDLRPDGTMVGMHIRPLKRVGVYVPGGSAAYPSSLLMNVIPARVAGVKEIVMATPPATGGQEGIAPEILVAAAEAGVKEIYRIGGAQAVAALAFGTETVRPVDKIVGPGNIYVALAKRLVYGVVDIDSIAGPSEIVVLADDTADPRHVAADMLSQAEHDAMASAVLVTTSRRLAEAVRKELVRQLADLPRRAIAERSLADHGALLIAATWQEAIDTVNRLAPEHLEIITAHPLEDACRIENAGAVFLGPWSSEPVGDYFAGPNHILPTNGTARFASPLSVDDFVKKTSLIHYSRRALEENARRIAVLARGEGLEAHARAVEIRLGAGPEDRPGNGPEKEGSADGGQNG